MPKPLERYVRTPKCKHCGHFRYYLDKGRQYRTDYCSCGGYHHKHRQGSKFCESNPDYEFNVRTMRYGEDPEEVRFDIEFHKQLASVPLLKQKGEAEECPF